MRGHGRISKLRRYPRGRRIRPGAVRHQPQIPRKREPARPPVKKRRLPRAILKRFPGNTGGWRHFVRSRQNIIGL